MQKDVDSEELSKAIDSLMKDAIERAKRVNYGKESVGVDIGAGENLEVSNMTIRGYNTGIRIGGARNAKVTSSNLDASSNYSELIQLLAIAKSEIDKKDRDGGLLASLGQKLKKFIPFSPLVGVVANGLIALASGG